LRKTQFVGGQIQDVCLQLSLHLVVNNLVNDSGLYMGGGWLLGCSFGSTSGCEEHHVENVLRLFAN